ncbi:hypothetical protein BURCENBC7_AP1674 [Burkholderia cenocepacia BC7]|nr:uncharacterized protein BCN122_II2940 [Burkholderia cenocepacia]ERI27311.1 hypothetical protein BURCENBC7_AP1674 [Burkholderia cenocepacia BC7]
MRRRSVRRAGWGAQHASPHRDGARRRRSVKAGGGILQEREMPARGRAPRTASDQAAEARGAGGR